MEATGTPREFADELWLALGFPLAGEEQADAALYSELDAEALRSLNGLLSLDLVKRDTLMAMTRDYNEDGFRVIAVATRIAPTCGGPSYVHNVSCMWVRPSDAHVCPGAGRTGRRGLPPARSLEWG